MDKCFFQLKKLVEQNKFSYFNLLNNKKEYKYLLQYVKNKTPLLQDDVYLISTRVYWVLNNMTEFPECPICGNKYGYNKNVIITRGYNKACSKKCSSIYASQKAKQTNLEKYGVEYTLKSQQVRQKIKQTNLEKYGVQSPIQNQIIKQRMKQTNLKKYGVEYTLKSQQVRQKRKQTNLERYGCQNPLKNQQVRQKIKQNNLEKYGVEYIVETNWFKEKRKQTNLEKYGQQNPFHEQKFKQTNLERYGCQYPIQNQKIKQKMEQTNLEKYGVEYTFQSQYVRQKIKQTNLERYGCQNVFQNENIKQKHKKILKQKYGVENPQQIDFVKENNNIKYFNNIIQRVKEYVQPLFDKYCGKQKQYQWKCKKCGQIFKQKIIQNTHLYCTCYIPRCLNCYPYVSGFSYLQKQLMQFVENISNIQLVKNSRQIIKPYQLDVYIPQKNIAIQFDGTYWHSDQKKPNDYHLMKTQLCKEKGIQLIHVFQDQWLYKQDIVKDRIKNILGIYDNRIFARKCIIKQISSNICNQFLDVNHIQGHDNSKIRLGLFYNEELISVMTFSKPRFNRNYEYELVRFASKLGCQVIGGASKLLKYFQRKYQPKNIITYADRRYSNGKLYYALGFEFLNNSEPNYWWCKNNYKYTRYQCQKHKLKQLLGQDKFNPQLSEFQNMYLNGYNKLYDCGNMVFIKQY